VPLAPEQAWDLVKTSPDCAFETAFEPRNGTGFFSCTAGFLRGMAEKNGNHKSYFSE
jgi:hypothetical protein